MSGTEKTARAVVVIPGFQRSERFGRRDALVRGLCTQEQQRLKKGDNVTVGGEVGVRLTHLDPADGPDIDVFEAYWSDMFAEDEANSPWTRLWQGLQLIGYWVHMSMVRPLLRSRYLTIGLFSGGVLLVAWYLSVVLLASQAIAADPTLTSPALPAWIQSGAGWIATTIGGWKTWALVSLLLGVFRADELARLANFAKSYLQNQPDGDEPGLRDRVRARVLATLDHIEAAGYAEVTVVAYSFGTLIACDIFADWKPTAATPKTSLVTWGSPIAVMQYRSKWLHDEVERLVAGNTLARWIDVSSKSDWLCAAFPHRAKSPVPGGPKDLRFDSSFLERALGRTHLEYYLQPEALAPLLAELPAA